MTPISRRDFVKGALAAPIALSPLSAAGQAKPSAVTEFDIVVAGAGHNSLTATAYLVTAGYKCLVLEGRPMIGGGTQTASLTLTGFKEDVCSSVHSAIQHNPMFRDHEIDLRPYGLEYIVPDPVFHVPFPDGSSITLWRDPQRTAAELGKFSKKDAAAYLRMLKESEVLGPVSNKIKFNPPGFTKPMNELLGELPHGNVWKRRMAMSAWDNIRGTFEEEHVRTFVTAVAFTQLKAPTMQMSGEAAYSIYGEQRNGRPVPKGGSGQLAITLAKYIEDRGGVILTNKGVSKLIIENGRCTGVECVDGSSYRAKKAVLSTMHVKDMIHMAPAELWGDDFIQGVNMWQGEATSAFVSHYATTEPITYPLSDGSTISPAESLITTSAEHLIDSLSQFAVGEPDFEAPSLATHCMTVVDPSRAPAGMHTVDFLSFAPFHLKEGPEHWDVIKEEAADRYLNFLRRFAPSLTDDKILARFCETPLDIWRRDPLFWHGSIHGGLMGPSQSGAMRPVPGWGDYRMPIPGLYLTGASTHPGGSVSGGCGRNAVMVMFKDFGTSIPEVLRKKVK
jgi:phytoene dehydrogenase-like protein